MAASPLTSIDEKMDLFNFGQLTMEMCMVGYQCTHSELFIVLMYDWALEPQGRLHEILIAKAQLHPVHMRTTTYADHSSPMPPLFILNFERFICEISSFIMGFHLIFPKKIGSNITNCLLPTVAVEGQPLFPLQQQTRETKKFHFAAFFGLVEYSIFRLTIPRISCKARR